MKAYGTAAGGFYGASTGSPYRKKTIEAKAKAKAPPTPPANQYLESEMSAVNTDEGFNQSEAARLSQVETVPLIGTTGHYYQPTGRAPVLVTLPTGHKIWRVPQIEPNQTGGAV